MEPLQSLQTKLKEQLPQLELREGEPMARAYHLSGGRPAACMPCPGGGGTATDPALGPPGGGVPLFSGERL